MKLDEEFFSRSGSWNFWVSESYVCYYSHLYSHNQVIPSTAWWIWDFGARDRNAAIGWYKIVPEVRSQSLWWKYPKGGVVYRIGSQRSEVRSQKSEVGNQRSAVKIKIKKRTTKARRTPRFCFLPDRGNRSGKPSCPAGNRYYSSVIFLNNILKM